MKRLLRILGIIILIGIFLLGAAFLYLRSESGQDFLTKQVVSYLQNKLKTPLQIKKVRFQIPDWVSLEGVYFEDTKHDTLIAGGKIHVDLDMWALMRSKVALNQIELENIRLKVNRTLPDTTFNFDFIMQAFASKSTVVTPNTSPLDISLKNIKLSNVHITYLDNVIGSDADVYLGKIQTKFDKFNLAKSQYHLDTIALSGGKLDFRLYKALKNSVETAVSPKDSLDLKLGKIQLSNFNWQVNLEESGLKSKAKLGSLVAEIDKIYLNGKKVSLKNVALSNTDASVEFVKNEIKTLSNKVLSIGEDLGGVKNENNWQISANNLKSTNVNLRFDDNNKPTQKTGLDYFHLVAKAVNFDLKQFVFSPDNISGKIASASFQEKSGLILEALRTDFLYGKQQTFLKNLYVKTPNTLLRDELIFEYSSMEQLTKDLGNVTLKAKITNSQLAFQDVLKLAPTLANTPPFKGNANEILKFDGILGGKINNLTFQKVNFSGFGETHLQAEGRIFGVPDMNKMAFDLKINEFVSSKKDILKVLPDSLLPASIELPNQFKLTGIIKGKVSDLNLDAQLNSDFGNATFIGNLSNFTAKTNQKYDGKITLQGFDVGKLIKQPENIGKITLNANLKGTGIDLNTANASINGTMQQAVLKGYDYKNLALTGNINNKIADFKASLKDENASLVMTSHVDLGQNFPAIIADVQIGHLNLQKLNLYKENIALAGKIKVDMTSTDPQHPLGKITVNEGKLIKNGSPITIGDISLTAHDSINSKIVTIQSPFLKGYIFGQFNYLQLSDILLIEFNKYFALPDIAYNKEVIQPYNFSVKATLANHPVIQAFVPALQKLDSTRILASLDNQRDTTMSFNVIMPYMQYDSIEVRNTRLNTFASLGKIQYNASFDKANSSSFKVLKTSVNGNIANNIITFRTLLKDSVDKDLYAFGGFVKSVEKDFRLNLQGNLLLNYQKWQADSTGYVQFGNSGILVKNFVLQQKNQRLQVNSSTSQPNSPIRVQADSVEIGTFLAFAQQDSLLASGKLEGNILLANYTTTPTFTGDLLIKNFTFTQVPIGDVILKSSSETSSKIVIDASLKSSKNDIIVKGNYLPKEKNPLDFTFNINKLGAETIKAFSFGQLRRASGNLQGNIQLKGSPSVPIVNGEVQFDSVAFNITKLGATYRINNEKLNFGGQQITLNKFIVKDTTGRELVLDGNINFSKIPNVSYDLKVKTENFMVLNASQKDNDFFYGQGYVDANLTVKGIGTNAAIDGLVKVREPSKISIVMPNDAQKQETEGIVKFVDKKGVEMETAALSDSSAFKMMNFASEISLTIEADDKSEMTIVIDELNGDNIKVRGNAQLNAGMTAAGQLYILGSYDLTKGSYDMTFQVLKKNFLIQKGSSIIWMGDPMKADVNITAVYQIDVAPYDLVADLNPTDPSIFREKIPFDVLLKMGGSLQNLQLSFDIRRHAQDIGNFTPKEVTDKVDEALVKLRNGGGVSGDTLIQSKADQSELNKQVFALIAIGSFLGGESNGNLLSGINPEAIARQSVSKLLSQQLNQLASLIKGVKVDFNLNSTSTDLGGSNLNRTDLNVGLSKGFLNDRLTVTVGRNFELENNSNDSRNSNQVFDNFLIKYNLSADGTYLLQGYRKNQYQSISEGFVVETGVSIAVTTDYDKFREILRRKK